MELVEEVEEVAVEQVELGLSTCWRREGSPDTAALARQFYFQSQAASPIIPPLEDVEEEVMLPKKSRGHLKQLHSSTALTVVLEGAHLGQESVTSYLV